MIQKFQYHVASHGLLQERPEFVGRTTSLFIQELKKKGWCVFHVYTPSTLEA